MRSTRVHCALKKVEEREFLKHKLCINVKNFALTYLLLLRAKTSANSLLGQKSEKKKKKKKKKKKNKHSLLLILVYVSFHQKESIREKI